jgi:hypothetical protein
VNWRLMSLIGTLLMTLAGQATGQRRAQITTSDTQIEVEAGASAPRLLRMGKSGGWTNRSVEKLIEKVKVGTRIVSVSWKLDKAASHAEGQRVRFVYESANPRLRASWEWRARAKFGPVEHVIRFENLGPEEVWIPLQNSLDFDWQLTPGQQLSTMYVEKGADTPSAIGTHEVAIPQGYSWTGNSSTYAHPFQNRPREIIPWVAVRRLDGAGAGWYAGIEFSGRTRLTVVRRGAQLTGAIGLNPEPGPFWTRILPQQSFQTPTVFIGAFVGDFDEAGNILRRWVRDVLGNPSTWENPRYPLMVNNSWGSGMAVDEPLALRMIGDSAELGLEMFGMDAGWFRAVGDWYPDPKKFPRGLTPVSDAAHKAGLKIGLWVDWAQAGVSESPGALNVHDPKVRDWLVTDLPKDWAPEEFKGQTIDIGEPAARARAEAEVERMVGDYHLDMLEHDGYLVAQGCVRKDHPHAGPDASRMSIHKDAGFYFVESSNSTDVSYHATQAYYAIQTKLRSDHPGILLEVCNDGGRMVDFGSAAHADYFSITDTYDPLSNRRAFFDTSHVLPPAMLESYVEAWPTPRIENFRFMLRSGMMGWVSIMQNTTKWSAEQHAEAKKEFQLYKEKLRPLIRDADLYHVSNRPDGVHWDGIEYYDPRQNRGVLYAFHGSSETEARHVFALKGLKPDHQYKLTFHDAGGGGRTVSGRELMESGVAMELPVPNSSELLFITDISARAVN